MTIRLLLVDTDSPLAIPARADGTDSALVRQRMARTIDRYAGGIAESVHEFAAHGLIEEGQVQVRVQPSSPTVKVYLLNGSEVFYGFYPVLQHTVTLRGQDMVINDPMGKDTVLFHQAGNGDPESLGANTSPKPRAGSTVSGPPSPSRTSWDRPGAGPRHRRDNARGVPRLRRAGHVPVRRRAQRTYCRRLSDRRPCARAAARRRDSGQHRSARSAEDTDRSVATPDQLVSIENACVAEETAAARESAPTSGVGEFLIACRAATRPVFILSNNSADAIHAYLRHHDLAAFIEAVIGRIPRRPDLMKPNRRTIDQALALAGIPATEVMFIGDSLTDLQVARATGLPFIGYAKNPRRGQELANAGSTANVATMAQPATAVREAAERTTRHC